MRKKRKVERVTNAQNETSLGDVWKIAVSPDTELALCQCCSTGIAEKD